MTVKRTAEAVLLLAALSAGSLAAQADRGPELRVAAVRFRGNHALDGYTLAISIATSASNWTYGWPLLRALKIGVRRVFDEVEFRRDVLRLQLLYRQHGYFEARVDTAVRRGGDAVKVTFRIAEGPPVVVDSIALGGLDGVVQPRRLLHRIPLEAGKPFNRFLFEASADTIVLALRTLGYPFATVFRNYTVDRATRLARVEYEVVPGPHARVGEIAIGGTRAVSRRTIRRSLAIREGDEFDQDALYESQRSLYQSDLFRFANVAVDPDSIVGGVDSLVRVRVQVTDGPRTRMRAGAGYATIDCFRTQATLATHNFMGGARRLDVAARVSKIGAAYPADLGLRNSVCSELAGDRFSDTLNYFASLTLTQPALFARRNAIALSAFAERRSEFSAYERIGVGTAASVGFGVGRHLPITFTYRLTKGRTNAESATFCTSFNQCEDSTIAQLKRTRREATLGVTLADAHTNSPIDPTDGHAYALEALHASPAINSQIAFDKVVAEGMVYHTVRRGWVLAGRVRGGAIRVGTIVVHDSTIRFVPPEQRFYAGGPTTVRGFGRNEMGPVVYVGDSATFDPVSGRITCFRCRASPLGSAAMALANLELRLPSPVWPSRFRLAAFVDAGELWEQTENSGLVPGGLRITPGMGLRIATPLGPMRFDVAYNDYPGQAGRLYVIRNNGLELAAARYPGAPRGATFFQRLKLHFSVGQPF
jgi:outer membrane protein assembly complex protein YaeT